MCYKNATVYDRCQCSLGQICSFDTEILTKLKINHFQPANFGDSRTEDLHSSQSFFIRMIPQKAENVHQGFTSYIQDIWTCTESGHPLHVWKKYFDCFRDKLLNYRESSSLFTRDLLKVSTRWCFLHESIQHSHKEIVTLPKWYF